MIFFRIRLTFVPDTGSHYIFHLKKIEIPGNFFQFIAIVSLILTKNASRSQIQGFKKWSDPGSAKLVSTGTIPELLPGYFSRPQTPRLRQSIPLAVLQIQHWGPPPSQTDSQTRSLLWEPKIFKIPVKLL
jgi:hypothetical protein